MRRVRDVLRDRQFAYDEAQNIADTVEFWQEEVEKNKLTRREEGSDPVCTPPCFVRNRLVYQYLFFADLAGFCVVGTRRQRGFAGRIQGACVDAV